MPLPSRRLFILAAAVLGFVAAPAAAAERPNVVLILIDDLGQRDLGCYGSTFFKTPNTDRLAAAGVRFSDYYAACPVCSPTRASIITGRYPQRLGITDFIPGRSDRPDQAMLRAPARNEMPPGEHTLAAALKANGYATAIMGKWHLGGKGSEPEKFGFDVNIAGDETGIARSYFAPFENKGGKMKGLEKATPGEYITDRLTTEAEAFITANKDRPFFLYLPHYAVHIPLKAPDETIAKYPGKPAHGRQSHPVYAAMVEKMDDSVGRIVHLLDDLKLTEKTLVIFTSDNGGLATPEGAPFAPTYNGPLREGKGYLYEGGIRVPLIIKGAPGLKPGTVCNQPSCSIDFAPTILELCGVKPEGRMDGVSLLPAVRGEKLPERSLFWHYPHYANQGGKPGGAVRRGDYKLIEFYEDGRRELFNVRTDIGENRNLSAEKPELVKELAAELDAWRKDVGARMPTPNPNYKPNPPAADGTITLHARTARVSGVMLRYEPLPHKDTLGFWVNRDDFATFEFTVVKPGTFSVEVLQGCGAKSGGAEVELAAGDQKLTFTVEETGGFQMFKARDVGTLILDKPGRYTLTVRAKTKPGPAVMDLRQIVLKPKEPKE